MADGEQFVVAAEEDLLVRDDARQAHAVDAHAVGGEAARGLFAGAVLAGQSPAPRP